MKKFLAVLIAIVVVVCIGLTTYYFLRNDEVISFNTTEIYCNVGDKITIQQLGKSVKRESKKTTYDYNAGGESVTDYITFDAEAGYYRVNSDKGGNIELVIKTSNKNYSEFKILVHIGDGSESYPYYISNSTEFASIGTGIFGLNDNYVLMSDIELSSDYMPIGVVVEDSTNMETNNGFTGSLDGNGHSISGLNLTGADYLNAGLFSKLTNSTIKELKILSPVINGEYLTAGALAGTIKNSDITKVAITNATIINNQSSQSNVGGLAGVIEGNNSNVTISYATGSVSANGNANVGGFAGTISEANVQSTYATATIAVAGDSATANAGGFAGVFKIGGKTGTIRESYAHSSSDYINFTGFISSIEKVSDSVSIEENKLSYLIGNYAYAKDENTVNSSVLGDESDLYDPATENYMVVPVSSWADVNQPRPVFYSVNGEKTYWSELNWSISASNQPTLKIDSVNTIISQVSSSYFKKDLEAETVSTNEYFLTIVEEAKNNSNTIENKKYNFLANSTIDLSTINWTPIALVNSEIDFNGSTIVGLNLNNAVSMNSNETLLGLFSTIKNSTIKNLKIDGLSITGNATYAGAVAGIVSSEDTSLGVSSIENIEVTFASEINAVIDNLGGIAGQINNGSIIKNCAVNDIATAKTSTIKNVAGLVALVNGNLSSISDSSVMVAEDGYIYGMNSVAGLVAINNGILMNNEAVVRIAYERNDVTGGINIAGLVAGNNGIITSATADVNIDINVSNQNINVAGIATTNNGSITSVTLNGEGINLANIYANSVYVGGLVVSNNGTIESAYNLMDSIGAYYEGKNYTVAGIAVYNSYENATITKVIAGSNIYGNTVAGIVVEMNNSSATINQVLVAKYDGATISANEIKGDRYVAGLAYNMSAGLITNVQAESNLIGATNSTRTSLIVLIFPDNAKINNATINSTLAGTGTFYRETWTDYDSSKPAGSLASSANFNLFAGNAAAGEMQSVIINTEKARANGITTIDASFVTSLFGFGSTYVGDNNSSYFKTVSTAEFNNYTTYTSNCVISAPSSWWQTTDYTFNMTFDFSGTWSNSANGIRLAFLTSLN